MYGEEVEEEGRETNRYAMCDVWGLEIIATYHSPVHLSTHIIHHIHKTKDVAYL